MKIRDMIAEGALDSIKTSAKKFWHGTSGEISRERKWPQAYEKAKIAYREALNSGDFSAIDKYSDLVNYFAILIGKPTLDSFQNRLLRQKWTKQDFMDYVKKHYAADRDDELTETTGQKVIIKLDPSNPMDDSMVATLGGAGSWSFKGLRDKARREADELAKRLSGSDHPLAFRDSAYNIRQLANTLNTIVAAYDELNEIRRKGGPRSRGISNT